MKEVITFARHILNDKKEINRWINHYKLTGFEVIIGKCKYPDHPDWVGLYFKHYERDDPPQSITDLISLIIKDNSVCDDCMKEVYTKEEIAFMLIDRKEEIIKVLGDL